MSGWMLGGWMKMRLTYIQSNILVNEWMVLFIGCLTSQQHAYASQG